MRLTSCRLTVSLPGRDPECHRDPVALRIFLVPLFLSEAARAGVDVASELDLAFTADEFWLWNDDRWRKGRRLLTRSNEKCDQGNDHFAASTDPAKIALESRKVKPMK
jgi:hypothetical protein